jgi:tetratricopeptide (TPR) repeat protein
MAALAERSDDTARFRADCSAGYLGWRRGDPDHGARLIRRAVARLEADPLLASRPELQLDSAWAWAWSNIGDHDRARACCERAVELARSQGAGRLPDALVLAACMDRDAGRWPSALAHGSQALDLALATGQLTVACEALITAGEIEAAQGRDEDCLRHARQADLLTAELGLRTGHSISWAAGAGRCSR